MRFSALICLVLALCFTRPGLAWSQPAIRHLPFDVSQGGRATDYAYHWSPNGDAIAVDFYNRLEVFDVATMTRMVDLGPPKAGAWVLLGWEPNNEALLVTRFASGGFAPRGYPVTIYDVAHQSFATWLPQSRAMQKGQWSPDGRYVALTGLFSGVRVYDARSTRMLFEFAREGAMGERLVWSPDSEAVAAVRVMPDYSEQVVVARVSERRTVAQADFESGAASVLRWSPDSKYLLTSADLGRGVRVLGRTGGVRCEMSHPSYLVDAHWSAQGDWFATTTVDGGVVVSNARDCSPAAHAKDASGTAPNIAWAQTHDSLAIGGAGVQIMHMPQGHTILTLAQEADNVAWSADGTQLAWKLSHGGVELLAMEAIGRYWRSGEKPTPWPVPNSEQTSEMAWSKARLRLHLVGKPGLTTVDVGELAE